MKKQINNEKQNNHTNALLKECHVQRVSQQWETYAMSTSE